MCKVESSVAISGCVTSWCEAATAVREAGIRLRFSNDSESELLASDNCPSTPSRFIKVACDNGV